MVMPPKPALLQARIGDRVECGTCIRRCKLKSGQTGFCGNYKNVDGELFNVGYGLLSALESRPIEIKPFFHFYPGSSAMTFSGWGCNFSCPWCQNHHLSKRKPNPEEDPYFPPEKVVEAALKAGDEGTCASFNEPTIHLEYLLDVFELAKGKGLYNTMVSNGSMSSRAIEALYESGLDAMNVDLKGCQETYGRYIGVPNPMEILKTARKALDLGIHVESVFLVVTRANDSEECIRWVLEKHLDYLGPEVPLHVNRYFPAYAYGEPPTKLETLLKVHSMARELGIEYVYIGNVGMPELEATRCPKCGKMLIERSRYRVTYFKLDNSRCLRCGYKITLKGKYVEKSRLR